MGWTFMPSRGRDRTEIIRGKLDWDNDTFTDKVLDLAVVGATVYLLVCRTPKAAWEASTIYVNDANGSFRWIAVFLTRKARDAYDFGYKTSRKAWAGRRPAVPGGFLLPRPRFAIPIQPSKGITPHVGDRNASTKLPTGPSAKPNSFTAPLSAFLAFSTSPTVIAEIALLSRSSSDVAVTTLILELQTAASIVSVVSTGSDTA
jgi:hypothetical protein